jgi:glyoxylase-like metal-dependent hydrolase (beta-lactamase superfamily II)
MAEHHPIGVLPPETGSHRASSSGADVVTPEARRSAGATRPLRSMTIVCIRLLRLGLFALAYPLLQGTAVAQQSLTPIRASEHVWYFQGDAGMASTANRGFNSNASFVVTSDGVVVFDALGTPELGAAIKRAIATVTTQPIRVVIVSHFHADHFYGLQALAGPDVDIWASAKGRASLNAPEAQVRLEQRRRDLWPYVDEQTKLMAPGRWIEFAGSREFLFERGGVQFRLIDVGGAHSPEDVMLWVGNDRVLLAGDLYFSGRIPFVGNADTRSWLSTLELITPLEPAIVIPGHGRASRDPDPDITLTRDYLLYLRKTMGQAARDLVPFDEAYAAVDWSRFEKVPAFEAANRINAYGTYLGMEQEVLGHARSR